MLAKEKSLIFTNIFYFNVTIYGYRTTCITIWMSLRQYVLLYSIFFNFRFTVKCNDCVQYFCLKLKFNIWWEMKEYKNVIMVYYSEFRQAYMCCRISDTYVTEYRYFLNWISGWLVMWMPTFSYAIWSLQHAKSFEYQKVGSSCMIKKIMKKIVKTFLEIIIWNCEANKVLIKKVSKIPGEVRIP